MAEVYEEDGEIISFVEGTTREYMQVGTTRMWVSPKSHTQYLGEITFIRASRDPGFYDVTLKVRGRRLGTDGEPLDNKEVKSG